MSQPPEEPVLTQLQDIRALVQQSAEEDRQARERKEEWCGRWEGRRAEGCARVGGMEGKLNALAASQHAPGQPAAAESLEIFQSVLQESARAFHDQVSRLTAQGPPASRTPEEMAQDIRRAMREGAEAAWKRVQQDWAE
ncbi:hypothetical protein CALCODRAFT_242910 [Calocera cornea HHB12733]|uniref:Uncharacterized protein n=1 Tax=Calocera cornea HHB12733 TaxID=1353952 RepID=A0A165GPX8_9BASI|nr:hypothetical protein CALCODRAFT_242910 [Calocera cornea HHB12733]